MGGSISTSESQQAPAPPVAFNPLTGVLLNLFGVPTRLDTGRGGIVVGNPRGGDPAIGFGGRGTPPPGQGQFANQVFGPEDFDVLRDQLDPLINLLGPAFAGGRLTDATQLFDESVIPGLRELAETGFRTDIAPIVAAEQNRLQSETVPSIRELAAANTGPFSTDFQRNLLGAGSSLGFNLGALQAELDEASAGRRAGGLSLASELPLSFASDVLGFQEEARASEFAGRPGTQAANLLQSLTGIPAVNAAPGQVGDSSSFSLGGGLKGGCWVAAEYFGWFTPAWWRARNWIMEDWKGAEADEVRGLYLERGRALAAKVRESPTLKALLAPFFLNAARLGSS